MRKLAVAVTVVATFIGTGIVQGQGKTDPALNTLAAAWAAAFNAKDAAKIASLYADDAVVMSAVFAFLPKNWRSTTVARPA